MFVLNIGAPFLTFMYQLYVADDDGCSALDVISG